jgi:hypothetical protein
MMTTVEQVLLLLESEKARLDAIGYSDDVEYVQLLIDLITGKRDVKEFQFP